MNNFNKTNEPEVGGLYMWTSVDDEEMAVIICEIFDTNVELEVVGRPDNLSSNVPEVKKAYDMKILVNIPKAEKVKYHRVTISHEAWHRKAVRKA